MPAKKRKKLVAKATATDATDTTELTKAEKLAAAIYQIDQTTIAWRVYIY
eukprot:COSAG01_NODE_66179_length_271_cov_0.587209_1_plen_49_part_01